MEIVYDFYEDPRKLSFFSHPELVSGSQFAFIFLKK